MRRSDGHLMVVDDDREIRDLLSRFLSGHGYRVTTAADSTEMRRALADRTFDLVILDLMLPGEDGLSICRSLRSTSDIPIIMLTVIGDETDRITGFESGADDYIAKPFSPQELLVRIRAVLRRTASAPFSAGVRHDYVAHFDNWKLDRRKRKLTSLDGTLVDLSSTEFDLLTVFAEHPQRTLSRDQLLDLSCGRKEVAFDRSIDMQVSRIRQKIEEDPKHPTLIQTVRGGGYYFSAEVSYSETSAA